MANKDEEFGEDFRFLVRMHSTDLDGKQNVANGLTGIKGISHRLSSVVASEAGVDKHKRLGDLSDKEIENLSTTLERVQEFVPAWMRNRRKDIDSGDDVHLVGSEVDLTHRDDLNLLKKIRSWKGLRHERNLPVRGQRTKANGRTGLTVGVQRSK